MRVGHRQSCDLLVMKRLSRNLTSPTIDAELLGWRLDILYSLGMAAAFLRPAIWSGRRLPPSCRILTRSWLCW